MQVAIDPTLTLTAPFESSQDCSGYVKLDGLEVLQIDTSACSTPTVITSEVTRSYSHGAACGGPMPGDGWMCSVYTMYVRG